MDKEEDEEEEEKGEEECERARVAKNDEKEKIPPGRDLSAMA